MNWLRLTKNRFQNRLTGFLCCSCFLFLSLPALSQEKLSFQKIENGLSNKYIRCILKDSYGFMWFGTYNGLNRYDGTNMVVYEHDPENKSSICHNLINAIAEDSERNIWIATAEGINRYNRDLDNFINIDSIPGNKNHLNTKFITSIYFAENGTVWLGTMGYGIVIYNPTQKEFIQTHVDDKRQIAGNQDYITAFFKYNNKIWVGTRAGLYYTDINSTKNISVNFNPVPDNLLCNSHIFSLSSDEKGRLLVTVQNVGLFCIEVNSGFIKVSEYPLSRQIPEINKVLTTFCDLNHHLWIGTENYGLILVKGDTIFRYLTEEGNPKSISSNSIWSIFIDHTSKAWIGTFNKGVCLADQNYERFETFQRNAFSDNTLSDNDVTAFAVDSKGICWIGTDGGGVSTFNLNARRFEKTLNTKTSPLKVSNNAIKALYYSVDNELWVGTWSDGIDRLNLKSGRQKNYSLISGGTGNNMIQCINSDKNKTIWAGTSGSGIFIYNKYTDRFEKPGYSAGSDAIPDNAYVSSIVETSNNTIWIGTFYGLYELHRISNSVYSSKSHFPGNDTDHINSNRINVIYEDSKGNTWFGTLDNGLNLLPKDSHQFRYYQKQDGLSGNMVNGILEDNKGLLWISSNKGITCLNPKNDSTMNYFRQDGLVSDVFYPGACYKTSSGELLFGSDNGFSLFDPDNITINPDRPLMILTDLKINNKIIEPLVPGSPLNKVIGMTDYLELNYKQTSFSISYAGISFTRPECNTYEYKLEGFDREWNKAGTKTTVSYTNLNPGKYRFIVKGYNNDKLESLNPVKIVIQIRPPVWKTWWAYSLYIITLALLLYFFVRIRIERIKMANSLHLEKMAHEKEHELNLAKTQFFTNISHEIRTPLSLIIGPLDSILQMPDLNNNIKIKLSTLNRNAKQLMKLVNELMDFRKIEENKLTLKVNYSNISIFISEIAASFKEEAYRRHIQFNISETTNQLEGWIDEDKISKVLYNLLSNAFKYTPDHGEINLKYEITDRSDEKELLKIAVSDNGRGIQTEDLPYIFNEFYQAKNSIESGTGIGLTLTKNLVELHHGFIEVKSEPGIQTTFALTIPVNREAYSERELYLPDFRDELKPDQSESILSSESLIEEHNQTGKPELLIVEDNNDLMNYLVAELSKDYRILSAANGTEGLNIAQNKIPDLILTDVMMPEIGGIELCRKLKEDIRTSHIPVILLTAKTTVDEQIQGLESGADIYITKPFNIKLLHTQIKQLIANRQQLYSKFSSDVHIMPGQYAKNKIDEEFLENIIQFITDHITDSQLGVEMISEHINLSRGQVYKKIKAITGQSAVEFIRNIRLKQAVKLMETRKYSLSEIAYQTGFASPSYFTRSFKEQYGKAPSDYLKEK